MWRVVSCVNAYVDLTEQVSVLSPFHLHLSVSPSVNCTLFMACIKLFWKGFSHSNQPFLYFKSHIPILHPYTSPTYIQMVVVKRYEIGLMVKQEGKWEKKILTIKYLSIKKKDCWCEFICMYSLLYLFNKYSSIPCSLAHDPTTHERSRHVDIYRLSLHSRACAIWFP